MPAPGPDSFHLPQAALVEVLMQSVGERPDQSNHSGTRAFQEASATHYNVFTPNRHRFLRTDVDLIERNEESDGKCSADIIEGIVVRLACENHEVREMLNLNSEIRFANVAIGANVESS
jgi:hypothetical protein